MDTPSKNIQVRVNEEQAYNFYGMYKFECGDAYISPADCLSSDCQNECNMFRGYGSTNLDRSIMAMRKVTLPNGYHSSIYADSNLLDFLLVFIHDTQLVSLSLINGYTVVGKTM